MSGPSKLAQAGCNSQSKLIKKLETRGKGGIIQFKAAVHFTYRRRHYHHHHHQGEEFCGAGVIEKKPRRSYSVMVADGEAQKYSEGGVGEEKCVSSLVGK